jgi:hypothetical protein
MVFETEKETTDITFDLRRKKKNIYSAKGKASIVFASYFRFRSLRSFVALLSLLYCVSYGLLYFVYWFIRVD